MRLNEIDGHYNPSFFNMVLETNEDISGAINKYTATFVHEFIHYIQDIILPYNIRMNLSKLRWFSNMRQSALSNGYIIRPFNDWYSDSKTTLLQYNMTMGGIFGDSRFVDRAWKLEDAIPISEKASGFDASYSMKYREFNVYTYKMRVNNGIIYNLGARDLLEYIAYKVESKHFAFGEKLPQLPYESVDLLFDHYGLSHVSDDIRLCVAEVCLYNDNPIRFLFVNFLENEEFKQGVASLSYNQVYKILSSLEFESVDGVKEKINHKTNRRLKQFEDELSSHYTNFIGIRNWIEKVSNFAETELANRFIFSDMYKMDTSKFEEKISWIISSIGLPLVMNNKEECVSLQSSHDNVDEFIQFYIFQKFFDYVLSGDKKTNACPIYSFCKSNGDICDEQCNCNLQKEQLEVKKCSYFGFLKSYGLTDIEVK